MNGLTTKQADFIEAFITAVNEAGAGTTDARANDTAESAESPEQEARDQLALDAAQQDLKSAEARLAEVVVEAAKLFDGVLPTPLTNQADAISSAIETAESGDKDAVIAAIGDAESKVAALTVAATTLAQERAEWQVAKAAFSGRFDTLGNHASKGDAVFIAPRITKLTTDFDAACRKAEEEFDYRGATGEVTALTESCNESIALADDVAEYEAIRADREARKNTLPSPASVVEGVPRDKVTEVVGFYDTAVAEFDSGKQDGKADHIAKAVAELRKIPDGVREVLELIKYANMYENAYANRISDRTALNGFVEPFKTHLAAEIALFSDLVDAASLPADKAVRTAASYKKAAIELNKLANYDSSVDTKFNQVKEYITEYDALKDRIAEIDAITVDNGKVAVEDYLLKMKSDKLFAKACFVAKDYANAIQAANATKGDFEDKKKLAEKAKDFIARKKAVNNSLKQVKLDGNGNADDAAATIETLLNAAQAEADAKNWTGAINTLKQAEARLAGIEAIGTGIKALNNTWSDVTGQAPDAAHAEFVKIRDKVSGDDSDNLMTAKIQAATKKADDALTAAQKGGDAGQAAAAIAEAMTDCYWLGIDLAHQAQYKTVFAAVKQAHETDLVDAETNKDNIIDWYISTIGGLKDGAKAKADAPTCDFPGALTELAQAEQYIEQAKQVSKDWKEYRPKIVEINDLADELKHAGNGFLPDFQDEVTRLEKYASDIGNAVPNGEFEKAKALVKEGHAFASNLKPVSDKYWNTKQAIVNQIDPMRNSIDAATAPYAKDARAQMVKYDQEIASLLKAHASEAAWKTAGVLHNAIKAGQALNKLAVQYHALKKTCQDTLKDYAGKVSQNNHKVYARLDELNEHFEQGIFDDSSDVSTWEARQNYGGGITRLTPIPAECAKLDADIKTYDDCKAQRDKVGTIIGDILKSTNPDIAALAARLRGKHRNAVAEMSVGNYAVAQAAFTELATDAVEAKQTADQIAEFQSQIQDAGPQADDSELAAKLEAAKTALANLRKRENAAIADTQLDDGETAVRAAEIALEIDPQNAKAGIATAMTQASEALRRIELFRQLRASAKYAREHLTRLDGHDQSLFVGPDIETQRAAVASEIDGVKDGGGSIDLAMVEIEQIMVEIHIIRQIADDHQKFVDLKKTADAGLIELEKSAARYAITDAIASVREQIATAAQQEQLRNNQEAMNGLNKALTDIGSANLTSKLELGQPPSEDEIAAILNSPGGDTKLDKIVQGLDPRAQRGVLIAAMKVRFGCDVEVLKKSPETVDADHRQWLIDTNDSTDDARLAELLSLTDKSGGHAKSQYDTWLQTHGGDSDEDKRKKLEALVKSTNDPAQKGYDNWLADNNSKSDAEKDAKKKQMHDDNVQDELNEASPNLQKLYGVMAMCPTSDTLDNDSMLAVSTAGGDQTGSFYSAGIGLDDAGDIVQTKKVVMREGEVGNSGFYGIALPSELETIEDDCKPVDAEPLSFFSWNTLHEVGHAVDDKLGAMRGAGNAKAGWEEHGSNVLPIAKEAAKAENFGYDENYIASYLSGVSDPPIPAPPDPAKAEEWERKRLAVRNWVDMLRESKNPWQSASVASSTVLKNGRVYQESYSNTWTSYELSARTKGVSGYQFRAPGEWFSELYAAYHSGKMNPNHPHRDWIASL